MLKTNPVCRVCGVKLTGENWYPSSQKKPGYICKSCNDKRVKQWRKTNPNKAKAIRIRMLRKRGVRPFERNKECALYLGVHIAERVLSHAFKDVQVMPYGNPGFDFICTKGKKIDVKSACKGKIQNNWIFHINHNTVADYFLCLAFDNREDLNPLHAWLLPGDKVNHLTGIGICPSTIHRWDAYRLDVTKVTTCCNVMRS